MYFVDQLVLECHILFVKTFHSELFKILNPIIMVKWNVLYVGKNDAIKDGGEIGAYRLGELSL